MEREVAWHAFVAAQRLQYAHGGQGGGAGKQHQVREQERWRFWSGRL